MSDEQQQQKWLIGGLSGVKDADEKIQQLCDQVKSKAEEQANKKFDQFEAKKYGKQVVSGLHYFVKVHVGGENYVHLKIYEEVPCDGGAVKLKALQENHTSTSPIIPF